MQRSADLPEQILLRHSGVRGAVVCKEHAAVVGATQVPEKAELAIDDLTFPLFPGLSHSGSLAGPYCIEAALASMLAR
jgi:hypothetical protein